MKRYTILKLTDEQLNNLPRTVRYDEPSPGLDLWVLAWETMPSGRLDVYAIGPFDAQGAADTGETLHARRVDSGEATSVLESLSKTRESLLAGNQPDTPPAGDREAISALQNAVAESGGLPFGGFDTGDDSDDYPEPDHSKILREIESEDDSGTFKLTHPEPKHWEHWTASLNIGDDEYYPPVLTDADKQCGLSVGEKPYGWTIQQHFEDFRYLAIYADCSHLGHLLEYVENRYSDTFHLVSMASDPEGMVTLIITKAPY